jgi:ankyrin repeat protein
MLPPLHPTRSNKYKVTPLDNADDDDDDVVQVLNNASDEKVEPIQSIPLVEKVSVDQSRSSKVSMLVPEPSEQQRSPPGPGNTSTKGKISKRLSIVKMDPGSRIFPKTGSPLIIAAQTGDVDTLNKLLTGAALDLNTMDPVRHWTALMWAAAHNHFAIVQRLVDTKGVDIHFISKDSDNDTALALAARYKCIEIAHFLMSKTDSDTLLSTCIKEAPGMYNVFKALSIGPPIQSGLWTNTSLLYPTKQAFCNSNLIPEEIIAVTTSEKSGKTFKRLLERYSKSSFTNQLILKIKEFFGMSITQSSYEIEEFILPVPNDFKFLQACLYVANIMDNSALFDNLVIRCTIDNIWKNHGFSYHVVLTILYLLFVICVSLINYNFYDWISEDSKYTAFVWFLISIVFILNTLFVTVEIIQIIDQYSTTGGFIEYILDIQNYLDWGAHLLTFIGFSMRCHVKQETDISASIMAIATTLLCLKTLYFLRPFKSTGPIVRMIFQIFFAIKELIGILIIVIFGFSQAMYLLSYHNPDIDFSKADKGMITAFFYMMGDASIDPMVGASNPELALTIVCLFIFITTILLLNLLIALMNSSYQKIQKRQNAEWHRERANIMIEQWRPWGINTTKYTYYLIRVDDRDTCLQSTEAFDEVSILALSSTIHEMSARMAIKDLQISRMELMIEEIRDALDRSD